MMRKIELARSPRMEKARVFQAAFDTYLERTHEINKRLKSGSLTVANWEAAMREELKALYLQAYASGRSGHWGAITYREWGKLGSRLKRQYAFLRGFARQAGEKIESMSLGQLQARTRKFAASARQALESAIVEEKGLIASSLPAMPGDGTTECYTNCKCRWAIRKRRDGRGVYFLASWRMGHAEHCKTCRARARRKTGWQNLEIRRGVVVSGYQPFIARH